MINEDLVDQPFLDKYCVGYDEKTLPAGAPANGHYKAYILGEGDDGIAKTPQWASRITGIPTERIIKLAREIGMSKPAYICQGWGPQRQANGELTARAIAMLPILTGNVGINGGNSGARESTYTITIERLPVLENPVKTAISCFTWTDAIARGPEMTASRDGVREKRSWMCRSSSCGTTRATPSSTSTPTSIRPTKFCRMKASAKPLWLSTTL